MSTYAAVVRSSVISCVSPTAEWLDLADDVQVVERDGAVIVGRQLRRVQVGADHDEFVLVVRAGVLHAERGRPGDDGEGIRRDLILSQRDADGAVVAVRRFGAAGQRRPLLAGRRLSRRWIDAAAIAVIAVVTAASHGDRRDCEGRRYGDGRPNGG